MSETKRISEKKLSKDSRFPFYEWLLLDPNYNKMNDKAKILYSYLRSKLSLFEHKQELFEAGEATKSYKDENGDLFLLADNTELEYFLGCSEPTLIKLKKELTSLKLLEEIPVKDKANRIYILEPIEVITKSNCFQEIDDLRKKKKEASAEKVRKHREKKKQEREEKKRNLKELSYKKGNLKELSYGNFENESYGNFNNLSKYISNIINLSLIPKLLNNLSILEEAYEKYVLSEILDDRQFKSILISVNGYEKFEEIENFKAFFERSINNFIKDTAPNKNVVPIRTEILPSFMTGEDKDKQKPMTKKEEEERRRLLQSQLDELMKRKKQV